MAAQGSGLPATNPFGAGSPSNPASPSAASMSVPVPQMLEVLGNMLQQNQEQGRSFMTAVQAMSVEQERQAASLREAVTNMGSRNTSGTQWSKLLQRPEVFRPKDREEELTLWYEWAWTFKQWMLAVNPEIHAHMEEVERDLSSEVDEDTMTDEAIAMGRQLYAILTTMLKERPLQLLKSIAGNSGFEAWRILHTTLAPTSKTRALALLGAISQYPNMSQGNLLEQLLKLEDLFRKYEQAASKPVPEDMKAALLLRILPNSVKTHLTMSINDESTYDEMREVILRWERSSQKWSQQIVSGHMAQSKASHHDDGGQADMEVDRVKGKWDKGKGKYGHGQKGKGKDSKGKGKGYSGKDNGKFGGGKYGGKAGKSKGREGKGRELGWGKGEKGKKGKGQGGGKLHPDACRICGKTGHWGNECWMKDKVRNVQTSESTSSSTTSSTPSSSSSTTTSSVKRVFNLAENDDLNVVPLTTVYEMEGDDSEVGSVSVSEWWCRMVQSYDLFADEDQHEVIDYPVGEYEVFDMTMHDAYEADLEWVVDAQVRGIRQPSSAVASSLVDGSYHQVVLDSGADLSVMPRAWLEAGIGVESTGGPTVRMVDAQGGIMPNLGSRCVTLDLGQACVQEIFHASDVDTPLLSLGRLLKKGWSLSHLNNMLHLCNVEEEVAIPVSFKKNSLVIDAQVFAVQGVEIPEHQEVEAVGEQEAAVQALNQPRIIVQTTYNIHAQGPGWQFLECGDPCVLTWGKARHDPSDDLGIHLWKYRTTLAFRHGEWELVDYEEPLEGLASLSEQLTQEGEEQIPIFTVMHRSKGRDPEHYGMEFIADNPMKKADDKGASDPVFSSFFGTEREDDEEVIDIPGVELPGVHMEDQPDQSKQPSPAPVLLPGNSDEHVNVDGIRLGPDSSARELRAGCQRLGLGMSGSKTVLYNRLLSHSKKRALEDAIALENAARPHEHQPRPEPQPEQPTPAQIAEHELTHVPFKKWCEFCTSSRSRRDAHRQDDERHDTEGGDPIICFDFFYVDVGGQELDFLRQKPEDKELITIMIVVDKSTGMCRAIPLPSKGDESLVHGAKEILGFIAYLGYSAVGIRGDNEPSAMAVTKMVCQARSKIGLKTVDKPCQPYEHATNGTAEQAVQGIRDLATTLLEQVKRKSATELRSSDDMVSWAYIHASMLRNAFAVRAGTTPFERAFHMGYKGKLACFGEVVYFALNQNHVRKGKPKFVKGVWLSKTLLNDLNICGTALGIYLSGTIRRLPPEQQWSKVMIKEFQGKPYKFALSTFGKVVIPGMKDRKKPEAIESVPLPPAPRAPPESKDAKAASSPRDEAASDPVSSPKSVPSRNSSLLSELVRAETDKGSGGAGVGSDLSYSPSQGVPDAEVDQGGASDEMEIEQNKGEKRPAPTPKSLAAPPMYAGMTPATKTSRISAVKVAGEELYVLDEHLDLEFPDEADELFEGEEDDEGHWESWHGRAEHVGPPQLSEEEMIKVEEASKSKEVSRLVKMGVLEQVDVLPQGAELLNTKHVLDWRFREDQWQRRARLVCKQLKIWDPNRTDVYAPSQSPSTSKLIPAIVASRPGWKMQSFDVKDAFLTVPQRAELYVLLDNVPYKVCYCLPGQQPAAAWWAEQLTADLKEAGLIPDAACPAAFGKPGMGATIHVDDGLMAGDDESLELAAGVLKGKYKLELSETAENVGDSVRFLKKEFLITESGIEIKVSAKYLDKIIETLDIKRIRTRKTPCSIEISKPDTSQELDDEWSSRYRAAVGSFLYLSPERPDCQWAIAHLARGMRAPTMKLYQHAIHLAEYLHCTRDVCQVLRWSYPGRSCLDERILSRSEAMQLQKENLDRPDLIEAISDSDWAGHHDRVSCTCGHVHLNGNLVYAFVRKQGAIALSSCEAELMAACSTAAEAIYVMHIVKTLASHDCNLLCRLDSSSARALLQKRGVSKVRHLDTKLLWLQRMANEGRATFGAISTYLNTSDIGTKCLSAERYSFLMQNLKFKGFSSNMALQAQYSQMEAKVLRMIMAMNALKGAMGTTVGDEDGTEPNAQSTNMFGVSGDGIHLESALSLSFHMSYWPVIVMLVMVGFGLGWLVRDMWKKRSKINHYEPNVELSEQSDIESEGDEQESECHEDDNQEHQNDQEDDQQQRDGQGEGVRERDVGFEPYDPSRHGWNTGPMPQVPAAEAAAAAVVFPELRFCPGHGQVYHEPGCGCLKSASRIATYTAEHHRRLHLAACGQCRPNVLPGSNPPVVRKRRGR